MYIQDSDMKSLINDMVSAVDENKHQFYKAATEALVTKKDVAVKTALLTRLYNDISTRSLIDFDVIPQSKGDFTRYKNYKVCVDTMDTLNAIYKEEKPAFDEVKLMNRIYDLLITLKPDFQYGFAHDIDFLKMQYNTLVLTFHELETLCIMAYLKYVRDVKAESISFDEYRRRDLLVLRSAKEFVSAYDRGEWSNIVKSLKKSRSATEALVMESNNETASNINSNAIYNIAKSVGNTISSASKNHNWGALKHVGKAIGAIGGGIALFLMLRHAVFYFYNKAARLSDTLKLQMKFLEAVQNDPKALNPKTAKMASKAVSLANTTVGIIDGKIFNADNKANKDIAVSDKALAATVSNSIDESNDTPDGSDDDFILM